MPLGGCSDGKGEFGERRREPVPWVDLDAEFVVAVADVLDEGMSGADHAGRGEVFSARASAVIEP